MTASFRLRLLLAYCDGDRQQARALFRAVRGWSHRGFRWRKRLGVLLASLLGY
jgi:hypothetical protein